MRPTNAHNFRRSRRAAFSLVETLLAVTLASFVGAAVLSAYLFIARSTARLANYQRLEVESRRALQFLNSDVRMAVAIANPSASAVTLTLPTATGTTTVSYALDASTQTFTRTKTGAPAVTLLTGVQTFAFNYYDKQDVAPTSTQAIKQVEVRFDTAAGQSESPAATRFSAVSARMLLQNKRLLNGTL